MFLVLCIEIQINKNFKTTSTIGLINLTLIYSDSTSVSLGILYS
ncbi:hypothetical protein KU06062659_170007 [Flavobacterium psychrophilum]|nr:hypothetical protein KU06062659_170007 [Flavobacterium psychrophilum]SNB14982.1 hypothetical protein KU06112801_430001 [Flavobacterium psychrophilum]SNB20688.1 hypothetical protein KU05112810_980009 [Flavobacterium psychrophilum]SNB43222.1 hypothetical protein LVDJXP189_2540001 [Flavobacterium psychrophilum]SNB96500.1 hypothetical protein FPC840_2330007 [Flavobacterium psychrophilum]